jgi:excisionase family DNA binding protein
MPDRSALFVRLSAEQAGRLERAAAAVPAHKKDLIGGLVERYVNPETPDGVAALRELTAGSAATRPRVTVDRGESAPVVGHHDFRPAPIPEVLDLTQAAEFLAVEESAIRELAERGELPGRRIGDSWRFSRSALLSWLGGSGVS